MLLYTMLRILTSIYLLFTHHSVANLFLHNISNVLNGIHVGQFPGHSRQCVPLHFRNVLVLLEIWRGARSCIKIYHFFGNTRHSHESVFRSHNHRRCCRVWRKQNEKHHAKCIQTTVKSPIKCASLGGNKQKRKTLIKVNGNMDSAKYQSDIILDIEMTLRCFSTEKLYLYT